MALIETGIGIADLKGSIGGVYFHRDKSGLHACNHPRVIHRRSPGQDIQRKAFTAARALSKDNRTVSYLMYRYLTGLSTNYPDAWTSPVSASAPAFTWTGLANVYDDSDPPELTYAEETNVHSDDAHYLTVSLPRIIRCGKIRFHVNTQTTSGRHMTIGIFNRGVWQVIFEQFAFPRIEWVEVPFSHSDIQLARVRIDTVGWVRLHEFDFYTLNNPLNNEPHVPVPVYYQIPRL